jgi:hypothetical protein
VKAGSGVLVRATLLAQRLHGRVPSTPVVRWLSGRLQHWGPFGRKIGEAYDVWTQPLIAGAQAQQPSPPDAAPTAQRSAHAARVTRDGRSNQTAQLRERPSLRCLIATDELGVGGMEEVISLLARRLPYYGIRTTLLYERDDESAPAGARISDRLREDGIDVIRASPREWERVMTQAAPDVVSAHRSPSWVLDASNRLGIPVVETIHGTLPEHSSVSGSYDKRERRHEPLRTDRIAGVIAGVIAVSDLARRQYLAHNPGLPPDRIITIPNAVDPRRMAPVDRAKARAALGLCGEFLFVCLARQTQGKNLFGLVTAFGSVATVCPDAHLLIGCAAVDVGPCPRIRPGTPGLGRSGSHGVRQAGSGGCGGWTVRDHHTREGRYNSAVRRCRRHC